MDYRNDKSVLNNGNQPNPFKNDKYLGNVLIIQEKSNGNEINSCLDDSANGGYIMFEFCQAVTFKVGGILDGDGAESAVTEFLYTDGRRKIVYVEKTGDNGHWKYPYIEKDVTKVIFKFTGSGSVEGISYSY